LILKFEVMKTMDTNDPNNRHNADERKINPGDNSKGYRLDHIAIESHDIAMSVEWHQKTLQAQVIYVDESWALMRLLDGTKIALVTRGQHPPHIGIRPTSEPFGDLKAHRDGSYSFYEKDPHSCAVYEWIWYPSQEDIQLP